ncbi:hypothetical protein T4B_12175 [Trichinella pseudospiralis]|uniref:Uncharacterized protein n=1 Tax=Trichinella pseudospiralis TaxID=6337 RepID=A0A0V1GES1_TRIPS|nr:hypothetical protein T4B_12175 [Trichinella pseudospiralis]
MTKINLNISTHNREPACLIRAVGSHVNQAIVRYDMANSATPR